MESRIIHDEKCKCEKIRKSGISGKEIKAEVVWTCQDKGRRARAKKMSDTPVPGKRQGAR